MPGVRLGLAMALSIRVAAGSGGGSDTSLAPTTKGTAQAFSDYPGLVKGRAT